MLLQTREDLDLEQWSIKTVQLELFIGCDSHVEMNPKLLNRTFYVQLNSTNVKGAFCSRLIIHNLSQSPQVINRNTDLWEFCVKNENDIQLLPIKIEKDLCNNHIQNVFYYAQDKSKQLLMDSLEHYIDHPDAGKILAESLNKIFNL